jgi:CubicO group peptidase (beta-lactamase class C family)
MRIAGLFSLGIFLFVPFEPVTFAADEIPAQERLDEYIGREMESQGIPGLSLAVVRAGKLVEAKGYGKASLELNVPATERSLYGLGSISKQFTATAIVLLAEGRRLSLDDRLTKFFGWVPKEWTEVTVRHLLTHTSGIREQEWKGSILEFDRFEHDQEEVVRTAFGPLLARPGEKFSYSNLGYRLLGMGFSRAANFSSRWDGGHEDSDPKSVIPNRARGYGFADGKPVNREPVTASSAFAQGALISSVLDMVKWDAA